MKTRVVECPAELIRVIDGDSVYLMLDLGFDVHVVANCRLNGIDAPERGQPGYREATVELENILCSATEIKVSSLKRGKYGRWIVDLYTDGNWHVNGHLLDIGLVKEYPR